MTQRVLAIKSRLKALGRSQNWAERRLRYSRGYLSRVFRGGRESETALNRVDMLLESEEQKHR